MSFAAEMIVPSTVVDDFGRETRATMTFLRYELELGYDPPSRDSTLGRLVLQREDLRHIRLGDAPKHLRWPHSKKNFRDFIVTGRRSGQAFISTGQASDGELEIRVHQDGGSRGQPRPSPARGAPRTVVATTTTASDPTILSARREFQAWRILALEPSAMRASDPFDAPPRITANGAHMAAALYRLGATAEREGGRAEDAYTAVASRAAALTDIRELRVDRDEQRQLLTLEARLGRGGFFPARALSDGTLRFLALCIMLSDPLETGVVCMEEPENGIHPARIQAMVELLSELAVDPFMAPGNDNPVRQIIVNTHSPLFVQFQEKGDLLFANVKLTKDGTQPLEALELRPLVSTWRSNGSGVTLPEIVHYLEAPPNTQIRLDRDALVSALS